MNTKFSFDDINVQCHAGQGEDLIMSALTKYFEQNKGRKTRFTQFKRIDGDVYGTLPFHCLNEGSFSRILVNEGETIDLLDRIRVFASGAIAVEYPQILNNVLLLTKKSTGKKPTNKEQLKIAVNILKTLDMIRLTHGHFMLQFSWYNTPRIFKNRESFIKFVKIVDSYPKSDFQIVIGSNAYHLINEFCKVTGIKPDEFGTITKKYITFRDFCHRAALTLKKQ